MKIERIGHVTVWLGLTLVANAFFLSLCTFVFAMWVHPLDFSSYFLNKMDVASDRLVYPLLIAGGALLLLGLLAKSRRRTGRPQRRTKTPRRGS